MLIDALREDFVEFEEDKRINLLNIDHFLGKDEPKQYLGKKL